MQGKSQSSTACRTCSEVKDIVPLCPSQHLYLKPLARMNISVQLPQLKTPGKSISSWEVMERLRKMAKPEKFSVLRVTKSTLEFIRFEGEIDSKDKLKNVVELLDMKTIKLSGFTDALKVRAAEAKLSFPTRHVWDSFFREAKNMNEMKPGERPDTIHISNVPCKWFTLPELQEKDPKPSEYIFRKVFETFGEIRYVDVPCIDPYRSRMKNKSAIKTFSFDDGVMFEGYIQFKEYVGFLKAMSALKGMLLMYKDKEKVLVVPIKVDFDRTKHMTDNSIKLRHVERERLIQQDADILNKERKFLESVEAKKEQDLKKKESDILEALKEEEEKIELKKKLKMEKIKKAEKQRKKVKKKLAEEERKLKMAQAKLENVELLEILLEKAKKKQKSKKESKKKKKKKDNKEEELEPIADLVDQVVESVRDEEKDVLVNRELELRKRLLLKYKRNLITKLEIEDKTASSSPSSLIEAKIAEVDAESGEEKTSEAEGSDTEVEIEIEKENLACAEEENSVHCESIVNSEPGEEEEEEKEDKMEEVEADAPMSSPEESESEGEIKSEGEASDSENNLSLSNKSDISSPEVQKPAIREKKGRHKKKKHKRDKSKVENDGSKSLTSKIDSHVEVVSNHWKRTTHHYTDQDGKRRGDTWIEGKQVYEVGAGGMPPWACPSDFYNSTRRVDHEADVYDKYFEKFGRNRDHQRRHDVSRGRSRSFDRHRQRSRDRGRSRSVDRFGRTRRSRDRNERPRSRSRNNQRSYSRDKWHKSPSKQRPQSRSSTSLSLSKSRSKSRSRSRSRACNKRSPSRGSDRFRPQTKSKSPPSMKISKQSKSQFKAKKISPVKSDGANVKERPKPLIMKMPSKRTKKTPIIVEVAPKVEVTSDTATIQSVPETPPVVPEQIERAKSASPALEINSSPIVERSPIPTDSIPLPDDLSKESNQTVQEVPVFNEQKILTVEPHVDSDQLPSEEKLIPVDEVKTEIC